MTSVNGRTSAPAYVIDYQDGSKAVSGRDPITKIDPAYQILPLLTVGDEVPLLQGQFGNYSASATETFAMTGIPDGIGYSEINGIKYVWVNHEFRNSLVTDISSTIPGQIKGARVSLFLFDQNWHVIGGKNLIETAQADGKIYNLDLETGNYIDINGSVFAGFDRFCSGFLAAKGFVDANGKEIPVYFGPEEGGNLSRGWAITPDGVALALEGLGRYSKEQVYAPSQYRAGNPSGKTVLISTEDAGDGEVYMYVGEQTKDDPNGFKDTTGSLYVLRVEDINGNAYVYEQMPENVQLVGKWIAVDDAATLNPDGKILSDWVNAVGSDGKVRSTNFRRPEDIHEDPNHPGTFYFVTTGTTDIPKGGTNPDNVYGMLHRFTLNPENPTGDMKFEYLMGAGEKTGVSYDNMVVDSKGNVIIQEDRTSLGGDVLAEQQRQAGILAYNIAANEGVVGEDKVTFLFQLSPDAIAPSAAKDYGNWESSGIVEVGGGSYLFDVQAHSITDGEGFYQGKHGEGGQLILATPIVNTLVGFASLPADSFADGSDAGGNNGNPISGNGRVGPFDGQPIQGFSGVQFAPGSNAGLDATFWFLSDNGFGAKANSSDYLLRLYQANPNFAGAEKGNGSVDIQGFVQLSDPNKLIPWQIQRQTDLVSAAVIPTNEDKAPFLLPAGFTQTKIVDRQRANLDPDFAATFGNWDMIALDPSNRYIFIPAEVGKGAGLSRYDTLTGDFVTALKGNNSGIFSANPSTWNPNNDDYGAFDPAEYTPYGTVLAAEEWSSNGRLFEWKNPLMAAGETADVVWQSNIPSVSHEGLKFDSQGNLYFVDESNTGSIYKFVPKTVGDLSVGQTFVLKIDDYQGKATENWDSTSNKTSTRTGAATWIAITDENGKALTTANPFDFTNRGGRLAADEVGGTPYGRPEDLEIIGDRLFVAVTSENTVYSLDLIDNANAIVKSFANRNTLDSAKGINAGTNLNNPDNLASDAQGNIYIVEDNEPGDIWKAIDSNNDGIAESISRWASLGVKGAEPTGLIATNNPNEFIVAIQHPDSDNDALWKITTGGNNDRLLTGADLDVESFVIANNGDIWIGDEFGPYLLHFNSQGELIEAPIPTPNIPSLDLAPLSKQGLGGSPLVIGHRGASGDRPEHTLEAYKLAIEQGADFIEPDLVITKDGVLIARHEPILDDTTNVAQVFGSERKATKNIDGVEVTGYFAEDFTLAEIKQLRAVQSRSFRDQSFNGQFTIPTFAEVIELVKQVEKDTGKKIGIYPETKHPTFFDKQGLSLEEKLVQTLKDTNFTDANRIFIQSFEFQNLIELQKMLDAEGLGNIPLVQLYGDTTKAADAKDPFSYPYDIRYNIEQGNDLVAIYGQDFLNAAEKPLSANTVYADLDSVNFLKVISEKYAEGVGPWKNNFLLRESIAPVDGNGDGVAQITSKLTGEITSFVDDAHTAGLQVHPYTLRNEERFLTLNPDGTPQTPEQEYEQLIQIGVDGFFTDFPKTGDKVRDQVVADYVTSPDNPDVLSGKVTANLGRSQGFEGMAFSPDRTKLYTLLEGSVVGDPDDSLRIYEFDTTTGKYTGLVGFYQKDNNNHAIGDFTPINDHEFLVIERDGSQGNPAGFKKIFKIEIPPNPRSTLRRSLICLPPFQGGLGGDLSKGGRGDLTKELVVDLMNIQDPQDLNGDGKTTFNFPFVTIEDVVIIDKDTILVANDNNYPFSLGRGPDIDNNEMILIDLAKPLNVDPLLFEIPKQEIIGSDDKDELTGTSANERFFGKQGRDSIFSGAGMDEFVYTSVVEGGDILTDFQIGKDKIDLSSLLDSLGYTGNNAIADGYVTFGSNAQNTIVSIDPDGNDSAIARSFILVENVALNDLNHSNNFIF